MSTKDKILNTVVVGMLREIDDVFRKHEVEFYLVGAMARDIQLASKPGYGAIRGTKDIDLAIMLANEEQFYIVKDDLLATGNFEALSTEPIKLYYKKSLEVDLLPFGGIENENRETRISRPKVFVLDMPGFQEVYSSVIPASVDGLTVKVCSLEGIVLLKLMANDDRPSRTKDITDIEHIIQVYFNLFDEEVYTSYFDIMELYDTGQGNYLPLVSARLIGRKIKALLSNSPAVLDRIKTILRNRLTDTWQAMLDGLQDE